MFRATLHFQDGATVDLAVAPGQTIVEAAMKSVARSVASSVGRALVRGILGSLKR